uniref:ubiquitinyl hydrolase 1 n=1 Tax=Melopsittacus undulatus TaxID=13146 RepID=A0A8V5GCX5_MELUD
MATAEAGSGSGGSSGARPDVEVQREELRSLLTTDLRPGESWYLVDIRWFRQWKKYVGFDSWDMFGTGDPSLFPGAIDNSLLFSSYWAANKGHAPLLLPTVALLSIITVLFITSAFYLQVVEYCRFAKHFEVEVYLLELNRHFSQADTIGTIEKEMRKLFNIPDAKEARLWYRYAGDAYGQLDKLDSTVQDVGLHQGQMVLIEVKNEDGTWPGQHILTK